MAKLSERLAFFQSLGGQALVDDILASGRAFEAAERRFDSPSSKTTVEWRTPGRVVSYEQIESGLLLRCEQGWCRILWLAPNCAHIRWSQSADGFPPQPSFAVEKRDWPLVELELEESGDWLLLRSMTHRYRIYRPALRLSVETLEGETLCSDSLGMQIGSNAAVRLSMRMTADEACYGLGERSETLNLRGKRLMLWNTDPPTIYQRGDDPLYYCVPFYLGVHNAGAYGLLWDNSYRASVDLGAVAASDLRFEAEGGSLSYYLFAGSDAQTVLSRYAELTGHIQLPPMWFLGYQQCRWSYYPEETVLNLAAEFRQRGIPCDAIYLDIHYMKGFRVFSLNQEAFPDLEGMIKKLHAQGFKVVTIVDPAIKVDANYDVYQKGLQQDVFLKYPDGERVAGAVWPGLCNFPDFAKASTRAWWAEYCKQLVGCGVDGLWNDMCEPVVFLPEVSVTLPDFVQHEDIGLGKTHVANHNVYGMLMTRATYEALEHSVPPDQRPVSMTRAGYAGTQRYASSWTGDNMSTWDHLRLSLSMTLNMGLSGAPMTGPDIGGFHGEVDGELFTRWLQAACFFPYFRGHTNLGTGPQEPWAFGQPYEVINRLTIQLRYRLLPYLYSVVAQCAEYGWPVIRPLFTAEPDNPRLRSVDDCYLLGDSLLVAPVLQAGAVSRPVYLPSGSDWYDYWTSTRVTGGQTIEVTAPLERLPLFVRAGSVLPHWPDMQYAGEQEPERLLMRAYPGSFETTLYEDDTRSMAYRGGAYRWIYITMAEDEETITINRRTAGNFKPAYQGISLEVIGLDSEPVDVKVDRQGAPLWFYDDGLLEVTAGLFSSVEINRKSQTSDPTLLRRPW